MLKSEFIPATETESRRLLVMMHGLGDSVAGYRWLPEQLHLPWLNYLLVNAPDPYFGGFSWFDFAENPEPGILRSRKMLFELLDHLGSKGFPSIQTIVGGFSQGGLMAWEAGLYYPSRLAGLICVSGYVFEPEKAAGRLSPVALQQKFLITHGTRDQMIPFSQAKKQLELLRPLGLQINWREFQKEHTIAGEEELSVIREFIKNSLAS